MTVQSTPADWFGPEHIPVLVEYARHVCLGHVVDAELKAILEHNRDEEKEHAAMVLEWIRRKDPAFSHELKDYLFTDKPIAHK